MNEAQTDTRTAEAGNVRIAARFSLEKQCSIRIHAQIYNNGSTDILLFNRLWTADVKGQISLDKQPAYRFVQNNKLRVLVGACPLPRMTSVLYRNIPYVTRVATKHANTIDLLLEGIVDEYSVYFPRGYIEHAQVNAIELIVSFVPVQPDMMLENSPLDPTALMITSPGALDHQQFLRLTWDHKGLPVIRRADAFDRLTLPGETLEPLPLR